jgi:hypothetical protein
VLSTLAAVLIFALLSPDFGARLFGPPEAARVDIGESDHAEYGEVRIPARHSHTHQAQSFGRVVGGSATLTNDEGRVTAMDSVTVGTRIATGEQSVQVALVGHMLANFEPHTVARWHSASPTLIEFGLASGALAFRYDRRPGAPILQVRTPTALVRVLGTVFTVRVDRRGRTTVSVLRGKVAVLDPKDGRPLAEVAAGFRFDVADSSYRDLGRSEVAAALPLAEQGELLVTIAEDGQLTIEEPEQAPGQIPAGWTVPGLSDDPNQRTLDRVLDPDGDASESLPTATRPASPRVSRPRPAPSIDESLLADLADAERERKQQIHRRLERCRELYADSDTRFRAARCLSDFMKRHGREPEAVEGLLLLGTLRMDFAHDYQSATRNIEEFLRRAPDHPKAELARYKLVLAAIDAGYIERGRQRARNYLEHYPDGQYVGRILQRYPELKSEL